MSETPNNPNKLRLKNTDTNRFKVDTGSIPSLGPQGAKPAQGPVLSSPPNDPGATQTIADPISLRDTATGRLKRISDNQENVSALAPTQVELMDKPQKTETVRLRVVRSGSRPNQPRPMPGSRIQLRPQPAPRPESGSTVSVPPPASQVPPQPAPEAPKPPAPASEPSPTPPRKPGGPSATIKLNIRKPGQAAPQTTPDAQAPKTTPTPQAATPQPAAQPAAPTPAKIGPASAAQAGTNTLKIRPHAAPGAAPHSASPGATVKLRASAPGGDSAKATTSAPAAGATQAAPPPSATGPKKSLKIKSESAPSAPTTLPPGLEQKQKVQDAGRTQAAPLPGVTTKPGQLKPAAASQSVPVSVPMPVVESGPGMLGSISALLAAVGLIASLILSAMTFMNYLN